MSDPPISGPPEFPRGEHSPPKRPGPPPWKIWLGALTVVTLLLCGAAGMIDASVSTFFRALGFCGAPVWLVIAAFIVLGCAGKRARTFCGFCGYDRTGFGELAPCPECGKDGTSLNAPGHRAVGHRPLPFWIWIPIVVAPLSLLVIGPMLGGRYIEEVIVGALVFMAFMLALGGWHAWNQGRSAP